MKYSSRMRTDHGSGLRSNGVGQDMPSPLDTLTSWIPYSDSLSSGYPTPLDTLLPWIPYSPGYHTPVTYLLDTKPPDILPPGRNLVSGIPYHHKGHGARDTLPPGKDMGPMTRKEPGTRDILAPCEQTDTCENITFPLWSVKRENL